jgi:hypothetical protein
MGIDKDTVEAKAEIVDEHGERPDKTVVDAVFDVGQAWTEYGLGWGKFALEKTADALSRTAQALGTVAEKLKTKKAA